MKKKLAPIFKSVLIIDSHWQGFGVTLDEFDSIFPPDLIVSMHVIDENLIVNYDIGIKHTCSCISDYSLMKHNRIAAMISLSVEILWYRC
jgi:hypothetical protein